MPGTHITDRQVRRYMEHRRQGNTQFVAAAKAGFSERSARRIEAAPVLPSQRDKRPRGRTRPDPLADVWLSELVPLLRADPHLRAMTLLEDLQRRYPERYSDRLLRTLQRRVGIQRAEGEYVRRLIEGRKMAGASSPSGLFHDYSWMMWKLFSTLAEFGFEYVIDSSKNSRPTAFRPFYLRRCGLPLYFVHLRRGFFDTMSSVARGTNKQFLEAQSDLFRTPRAVIGFHLAQSAADRWRREGGQAYMKLSFEQLMCDPAPEIAASAGRWAWTRARSSTAFPRASRFGKGLLYHIGVKVWRY